MGVETKQVIDRGQDIVGMGRVADRVCSKTIGGADHLAGFDPRTEEHPPVGTGPMFAATPRGLG